MARVSRVVAHHSIEKVKQKLAESKYAWQQKWLIMYNTMVDPREAQEIAPHTSTSVLAQASSASASSQRRLQRSRGV